MPIRVEIYGATGVAIGVVARQGRLRDILDEDEQVLVERVTWHPIDGSAPQPHGELAVGGDDILIAVAEVIGDLPVHASGTTSRSTSARTG